MNHNYPRKDQTTCDSSSRQFSDNRSYYQHMYEQVHATDEFKERLITMNTIKNNHKKLARRTTWKAAAAIAALTIAIPTGAYAANHYFGISEFFSQSGQELADDANKLIETDIAQKSQLLPETDSQKKNTGKNTGSKTADSGKDGQNGTAQEVPVTFTIQEALCDSGTIHIVVEAKAVESGKYLLVPDDLTEETDSAESIGIPETISIGDYAKKKGLEILYIGTGFDPDSPFFPASSSYSSKSIQDDTLATFISADRSVSDTDLNAILAHTIRPASASADADIIRAATSFALDDKSTGKVMDYQPKGSAEVPGTQARVTKVSMEQTEVYTYVTVYYTNPQGNEEDGLYFGILDNHGNDWHSRGGRGIEKLKDGSYCLRLTYECTDLPETCKLKAFDCFEKNSYGQMELVQAE